MNFVVQNIVAVLGFLRWGWGHYPLSLEWNLLFSKIQAQICMKMKGIGPRRGRVPSAPPFGSMNENRKNSTKLFQQESETKRNRQIRRILSVEFILDSKTIALVLSETCRSVWKQSSRKKLEEDTGSKHVPIDLNFLSTDCTTNTLLWTKMATR